MHPGGGGMVKFLIYYQCISEQLWLGRGRGVCVCKEHETMHAYVFFEGP